MNRKTALLLIDVQQGFDQQSYWGGRRNNPDAEEKIADLLAQWRMQELPIIHVKHNSLTPGSPLRPGQKGNQIKPEATPRPDEVLIVKQVNSAFIGTPLEAYLKHQGIQHLVICGFITDHCVSTTARMGANLGFSISVVEDATVTFDRHFRGVHYRAEDIHQYHLLSLQQEFAEIVKVDEVIKQHDYHYC